MAEYEEKIILCMIWEWYVNYMIEVLHVMSLKVFHFCALQIFFFSTLHVLHFGDATGNKKLF